jgi:hypothetical protein
MKAGLLGGGLVVLVVGGKDGFQVLGFEYLVAIQASKIVHPVTPGQHFSAGVIAGLHRK